MRVPQKLPGQLPRGRVVLAQGFGYFADQQRRNSVIVATATRPRTPATERALLTSHPPTEAVRVKPDAALSLRAFATAPITLLNIIDRIFYSVIREMRVSAAAIDGTPVSVESLEAGQAAGWTRRFVGLNASGIWAFSSSNRGVLDAYYGRFRGIFLRRVRTL